jgi:hypothetical protein
LVVARVPPAVTREHFRVAKLLAILLFLVPLAIGSPALAAGERAAVIYPNEAVSLNGVPISRATPVFPGDTIATGPGATATIISEGTQIALPEIAVVTYGEHSVMVVQNGARISTVNGFVAHSGFLTVSPQANSGAEFELKEDPSGTRVTSRTGSLSIDDGRQVVRLDSGNSLLRNSASGSSNLLNPAKVSSASAFAQLHGTSGAGGDEFEADDRGRDGGRHCRPCRPPESPIRPCHHHHDGRDDDRDRDHDGDDCRCRDDHHH